MLFFREKVHRIKSKIIKRKITTWNSKSKYYRTNVKNFLISNDKTGLSFIVIVDLKLNDNSSIFMAKRCQVNGY